MGNLWFTEPYLNRLSHELEAEGLTRLREVPQPFVISASLESAQERREVRDFVMS